MENKYDNPTFFAEYAKMARSKEGLKSAGEWKQFQTLFPDLVGKKVVDLGCGYGWHCQHARKLGAKFVLGIDSSEKMIAEAKRRNEASNIEYEVCPLESFSYPLNAYDVVISNLVLHYIPELDPIFANIYRTLRPNGFFLLNIEHPIFTSGINQDWNYDEQGQIQSWPVDQYFYPGIRQTNFLQHEVTKYHHTFTQILMGLRRSHFMLDVVEEVIPSAELLQIPGMIHEMRRPMMLLIRAQKS